MAWPATYIVDAIFGVLYVLLAFPSLYNVFRHGHTKSAGFIFLAIFCVLRIAANIMLIYSYKTNFHNTGVLTWGYILRGLGYSFLISSSLALFQRAKGEGFSILPGREKKPLVSRVLHLANVIALVLLIVGYESSDVFSSNGNNSNAKLGVEARVGDIIFILLTIAIIALACLQFSQTPRSHDAREPRLILVIMLAALPFMLVRAVYVTYAAFQPNPFQRSLALQVVLEYIMEIIVVALYATLGIMLARQSAFQSSEGTQQSLEVGDKQSQKGHTYPPAFVAS